MPDLADGDCFTVLTVPLNYKELPFPARLSQTRSAQDSGEPAGRELIISKCNCPSMTNRSQLHVDTMGHFERQIHQIAALPLYVNATGDVDFCIVTARGSGRWIIPKGNPIRGLAPHEVAAREALEEAGLVGEAQPDCIGTFTFDRRQTRCSVDVYVLKVERQLKIWPEMYERTFLRCNAQTAMRKICSEGLTNLIDHYLHTGRSVEPTDVLEQSKGFA